jgi:hypothetical protein
MSSLPSILAQASNPWLTGNMAGEDIQPEKIYDLHSTSTFMLDFQFDKTAQFAYFAFTGKYYV